MFIFPILMLRFSDALVVFDVAVHVGGDGDPLLTSSLVLLEASPFLGRILSSLNHCHGCHSSKTIILAEEKLDIVNHLLNRLHANFLNRRASPLELHEEQDLEELCRRLAIRDTAWSSPPSPEPSTPVPDDEEHEEEMPTIVNVCTARTSEAHELQSNEISTNKLSPHSNFDEAETFSEVDETNCTFTPGFKDLQKSARDEPEKTRGSTDTNNTTPSFSSFSRNRPIRQRFLKHPTPFEKNRQQCSPEKNPEKSESEPTEKSGKPARQRHHCGNCLGCAREEDCGECVFCVDKPKFGGPGVKKQKCELRWCEHHPRINRGPGSLRQEALKCKDCGEEYFSNKLLDSHMKIAHDKYEVGSEFYKVRDPSFTLKRVDKDDQFENFFRNSAAAKCDEDSFQEKSSKAETVESADECNPVIGDISKQLQIAQQNNAPNPQTNENTSAEVGKSKCSPEKKVKEILMMKDKLKRALEGQQVETEEETKEKETDLKKSPRKKPRLLLKLKIGDLNLQKGDTNPPKTSGSLPRVQSTEIGISNQQNNLESTSTRRRERMTRQSMNISPPDLLVKDKSRQLLKCSMCDQKESNRSSLYGHYARCHFKEQLLEKLGPEKRECHECQPPKTFKDQSNVVAHFGRVHDLVEQFLSPENRIARGVTATKEESHGDGDADKKEFENEKPTEERETDCKEPHGLVESSPNTRRGRPSCIRVGPKKKEKVPFLEDIVNHENTLLKMSNKPRSSVAESPTPSPRHDSSPRILENAVERLWSGEDMGEQHAAEDSDDDDLYVRLDESGDLAAEANEDRMERVHEEEKEQEEENSCRKPIPPFASMLAHMVTLPMEEHLGTSSSMVSNHIVHPLPSQTQCQSSQSNQALEFSQEDGETVKEIKQEVLAEEESSSESEDEDCSEKAKELYQRKLHEASKQGPTGASHDIGAIEYEEDSELYELPTDDGEIDIKDDLKGIRAIFDDDDDDDE